jgi:hypothetical protein
MTRDGIRVQVSLQIQRDTSEELVLTDEFREHAEYYGRPSVELP